MGRQDWRTPKWLFDYLNRWVGGFDFDAYASDDNHLCDRYNTKEKELPWSGNVFANPPFKMMSEAIERARAYKGGLSVVLGPDNTSTKWFHTAASCGDVWIPNMRVAFWHPEEKSKSPDRSTLIFVFSDRVPCKIGTLDLRSERAKNEKA